MIWQNGQTEWNNGMNNAIAYGRRFKKIDIVQKLLTSQWAVRIYTLLLLIETQLFTRKFTIPRTQAIPKK